MKVDFYDNNEIQDGQITFVVIVSKYKDKWIVVRHRERSTWEVPGGHREELEDLQKAAERELYEETGATEFIIFPVCIYSVRDNEKCSFGKIYFADVNKLGQLPELEIKEIKLVEDLLKENLTYPLIQPFLYERVKKYLLQKTG